MKRIWSVCVVVLVAWEVLSARAEEAAPAARHVVVITVDGMRPAFYLKPRFSSKASTLFSMSKAGAFAQGAIPAYPSLTYAGHANISTGVRPARHGIVSGTYFRPPELDGRGQWYAGDLKAPAIWDYARAAGLTVAALSWPSSATATNIDWNFPEFWSSMRGTETRQVLKRASPYILDLLDELYGSSWPAMLSQSTKRDALMVRLAEELILREKPNLLLIHLVETDKAQHKYGVNSSRVLSALKNTDAHIRRLRRVIRDAGLARDTAFIIAGDHGFVDVRYMLAPNALLAQNGFLRLEKRTAVDWKAMVENTGGSAGVYLRDPEDAVTRRAVQALFQENARDEDGRELYRIISRKELDALETAPDAAFYLEGRPPYMFSGALTGAFLRRSRLGGNHGYRPELPEMQTGFVAYGAGIRAADLRQMALVDIAPTIASLLGFEMPEVEGRVLTEILK